MAIREDLTLAAFAVANGFTLQTDRMGERGDSIRPQHFDPQGIPHDGLQFTRGNVHVWATARGWRCSALVGERYTKPQPHEFHGRLIDALRAAILLDS